MRILPELLSLAMFSLVSGSAVTQQIAPEPIAARFDDVMVGSNPAIVVGHPVHLIDPVVPSEVRR